uniref:testis-expressed protein 15 n=1 Tax=Jaculus jaculus TaxID=51337 RepID=UPI001E1B5F3B|nr:testis-expressed protein 15 [Jaculus jaculus]
MEMKENSKHKTWKMSSTNDPSLTSDSEASSLKRFTIPKIGKTTEEVFLSACSTSTREYSFIHSTLRQCRLNVSCDLQLTWQFGETKLIRNKDLERKFSAKRSEMRESGRHGRELEEHFCFLVPPQSDVIEIYEHGISAKASTLKILGNPLLGIYIFRHVDVALNYAHSRSIVGQSIVIFKVLFGRVKKIQPCMDKNKVSLDPSPNFDCHMSRYTPSLKDAIELQAYNSAVYAYEYDIFSKPVDKPRQCLPYAIVTVKYIGQKAGNGHLMTSLRFSSSGFPRRFERTCALSNCTVAKRIGKGKDATVIFEHFRKPLNPYVQENCSCSTPDSERDSYNSYMSNTNGNMQNGNFPVLETHSGWRDNCSAEIRDPSQVPENNSDHSFMPHDNREIDVLFNLPYLKSILSNISAAYSSHNNTCSSTVITSKLIKDPRLIRREQNMGKKNNSTVLSDISPPDNHVDHVNSGINLSSLPTNSRTSSAVVPGDHAVLTNHFDASCFQVAFEDTQFQTHNMGSKDYDCIASNEITTTGQCKEQCNFALPISLSNVVSEVENQKHSEGKAQSFQKRNNFPFLTKQSREPPNSKESVDTCRKDSKSHISRKSQCSNLKPVNKVGHQVSIMSPLQKKGNIDEYIENTGMLRTPIGTEDNSKCGANQNWWKESNTYLNIETKIVPVNNCNILHQEYKEGRNLNSVGGNCDKRRMSEELQVAKSNIPAAKDKDERDHIAVASGCNLTSNVECFSQKDPQCSLEYEDTIHTSFATSQKLMELKNQNCVNIVYDASQEAEGIPQAKEVLIDKSLSEGEGTPSLDNSNCNISREYMCVKRKNKNEPLSLESIQKDYKETLHPGDEDSDPSLFYSSKLNINNTNFKGQKEDKENPNEAKEEDSTSSPEYNIESVDRHEKHDFHMDNMVTNIVETGESRNYNTVEILSSEGSSKFNLFGEEKDIPTDSVTAIKQRSAQNGGSVQHLASTVPEFAGVSVEGASNSTDKVSSTTKPTLSTDHETDQRCFLKDTCPSGNSHFSLIKHRVSDYEINMDKNKFQYSFYPSVNENSSLENVELANEAEIQCDDALLWPRDTCSHENVLDEEFELYEVLKSRIDWEGLFGGSNEEREPLGSSPKGQNNEQHSTAEANCVYSFAQKNKRELLNSILLPDLQVTVIDGPGSGFSLNDESFALTDFYKSITESSKPEINEGKASGLGFFSQPSGENSSFSCEDKLDNSVQEPGLVSKSEIFHSSDFSHNIHENNTSEKLSCESLTANLSAATVTNESKCSSTKPKTDFSDARNEKDKRRLLICPKDQTMSHKDIKEYENSERRRKVTSRDSCEWFSSLSQGRMKTFSQSERHIRSVLNILNSEASLCKSKRLSKKLDRAVLHLKKAHRRVNTSLQIISNVGKKRKSPLPKAYAITCNNFWESCDLQGSVSERRYSRHALSKTKYGEQGEKRLLRFDIDERLGQVSKHKSYRTNPERIAECLPSEIVSGSVSQSLTTTHVKHCDEQHPESQLPLTYICQKRRQSEENNSTVRNANSLAPEHSSEARECMLYPDETLTEKEYHTDSELVNSANVKLENHSTYNSKDVAKENNSEPNAVIHESNLASLSCIKDNRSPNTDNCDASGKADSDMLVSKVDFSAKHFLNANVYKQDNLRPPGCKRNQVITFPIEECTIAISTLSIPKGNILTDPLSLTASKIYSIPPLSSTLLSGDEEESSESSVGQHRHSAASTAVLSCPQLCRGRECLKTKLCCPSTFHVNGNEIRPRKHSKLDLTSVTEESKSCKKNITEKLFSNGCSLLFKDNLKYSSKRLTTKDIHKRKIKKTEQAVYPKSTSAGAIVNIKYKSQEEEILKEFFHLTKKTNENNVIDTYLSTKNATLETITLKNMLFSHLSKRKKMEKKVSSNSLCDSISKTAIIRTGPASPETSNATALQEKPMSYRSELPEKHCLANCVSPIAELSQILQRADESSSLQILGEETKICQNILPLFVEAFERKQECSLEQILISRELLVEQNLWNNCNRKLKPCAIDTLVELQIVMETIQFIENKKRYLKGEPTFRSLLWYDETLYDELLGRPRGYQMQPNFYPAFQGRLKYNALCELQNYHSQLVKCFAETKKENSYYALLKYKRQINECKAIMKHSSDCFDFCLSVPFTCGVNFGDTLEDLETIRKSILKLITAYEDSLKIQSLPGKKDHLWIIIELISSKVNFIKTNEEISIKISLYGLEHICFDAAKHLVWKEKSYSFLKNSQKKNQEMLVTVNKCAFSRLQKIYDTLIRDLNNVTTSNIELEEDTLIASRQSDDPVSIENYGFPSTLLSQPDICCVSEILDQAEFADVQKLQELTLRCTEHLEVLKKCFQKLQDDDIDDIFVTEENVLDVLSNQQHGAVILKPAAVETYIDVVMLSETVHFLKNSMAKKLNTQTFRGLLWFDLSLLPELTHCQEQMASFSLNDNPACLWKVIESTVSELKKELDAIYGCNEAVNCSYALHLFSRELEELSEIKNLVKNSECSISTYIDFVPYIASINYGNTVAELEHNYNQFAMLLKTMLSFPQKDLGKMAHVMKVMKTIKHMKIINAKSANLSTYFILYQMLHNKNTSQLEKKEKMNIHVTKPEENSSKPSTSTQVSSISECISKTTSDSSKKRPIAADEGEEDSWENENTTTISSCKKQKVAIKDVTEIDGEKTKFKFPRTMGPHPRHEIKVASSSSDDLERNCLSPKMAERRSSFPGLPLSFKNLQDACTSKSDSKMDLGNSSPDIIGSCTQQQENLNSIKKTKVSFSAAEINENKDCPETYHLKCGDGTFLEDYKTPSQKLRESPPGYTQKTCLSNTKTRIDQCLEPDAAGFSVPTFHSAGAIRPNLEMSSTDFEHQDNEIIDLSVKADTGTNCPEPLCVQDKILVLQANKTPFIKTEAQGKYEEESLNPSMAPCSSSESSTLVKGEENPKVLPHRPDTCWREPPQPAYVPVSHSEQQFGASYPSSAWCVYHYNSSSGSTVTHTYQGTTSHERQSPPGTVTAVASTVQSTHSHLLYSEYFRYCPAQPQVNAFIPGNSYFPSQMPIPYNFQQPIFSQFAFHQPLPQAAYPYPPNPGVFPEVPWIYAPWQQQPFPPRH